MAKKQEVAGLPDPDKQQNAEMKSVVAAASHAVRPVQSVVSATTHHTISASVPKIGLHRKNDIVKSSV